MDVKLSTRVLAAAGIFLSLFIAITVASSERNQKPAGLSSVFVTAQAAGRNGNTAAETVTHAQYVQGNQGFFHPDRPITRAQIAQMFANLHIVKPGTQIFCDVPEGQWYAPAVNQLSGILTGYGDGTFRPDSIAKMSEFVAMLCCAMDTEEAARPMETAADRPWYSSYWDFAAEQGWFPGEIDVQADMPVTRAVAVTMINRALGRLPDADYVDSIEQVLFVDVLPEHWAYAEILEAAVDHQCDSDGSWVPESVNLQILPSGMYFSGGAGYYVEPSGALCRTPGILELGDDAYLVADETGRIWADNAIHPYQNTLVCCARNGKMLRNNSFQGFYFDEEGFYTSGSNEIDGFVTEILAEVTDASMSQEEKLRAVFDHVRAYGYLGRNAAISDAVMSGERATAYASKIFETGKGDCYNFTAAFYYLARALGYDATARVGTCYYANWGSRAISHAWVEIPMEGTLYLFDPQIENFNLRRGISNERYGAFGVTYQTACAAYYKNPG